MRYVWSKPFWFGTRFNPVPSRGIASISMIMPHHMLPGSYTWDFFGFERVQGSKIYGVAISISWRQPDWKPLIRKRKSYEAGDQYHSKNEIKEPVKQCCNTISGETIKKLTSSMDERLVKILEGCINNYVTAAASNILSFDNFLILPIFC